MEKVYDVGFMQQKAGQVTLKKEGLYWRIFCRLENLEKGYYRLNVNNGSCVFDLGLCVPVSNGFGMNTTVPIKRIGEEGLTFFLESGKSGKQELFVPIRAEEPFAYLQRLEKAYLDRKDGILGLRFRD